MAYADYRQMTGAKLRDTAGIITPAERDLLIQEALRTYSDMRPRTATQILTGTGTAVIFALPADFDPGFSAIQAVEHPVGRPDPEYLDESEWAFYRDAVTEVVQVRLLGRVLGAGVTAYLTYTLRHVVSEGAGAIDTVRIADREAVCDLAASLGFEQMAAYYGQEMEPSLASDLTRGQDRARLYLDLAARRRRAWEGAMGITRGIVAASLLGDLDVQASYGGPRFFHSPLGPR